MTSRVYSNRELNIEVRHDQATVEVLWSGRSTAREPGAFVGPILTDALRKSTELGGKLVLDFRELQYMNSSTITPVIRVLHEAKKGTSRVAVLYHRATKWQELSFSALTIFETDDKRIEVCGV